MAKKTSLSEKPNRSKPTLIRQGSTADPDMNLHDRRDEHTSEQEEVIQKTGSAKETMRS